MDAIRILQLGPVDLSEYYQIAEQCDWFYEPDTSEAPETFFDMAILCRSINEHERDYLFKNVQAYRLFYLDDVILDEPTSWLIAARKGKKLDGKSLSRFLLEEPKLYFNYSYGEKMKPGTFAISDTFAGKVTWNGYTEVILEGDFGSSLSQIAYWRYNLPLDQTALELWL